MQDFTTRLFLIELVLEKRYFLSLPKLFRLKGYFLMVDALKIWWARLSRLPYGRRIFSWLVGLLIPYTGSISPQVLSVTPGFAVVLLRDRRCHRNHLRSIHALALANLGEFTTGLAVHFGMSSQSRAILTALRVEFLKKARGDITAKAEIDVFKTGQEGVVDVLARLCDSNGDVVATVVGSWLIGKTVSSNSAKT